MLDSNNTDYYQSRAVDSRKLADLAKDEKIRAIHLDMASRYDLLSKPAMPRRRKLGVVAA
jgi:hypothetical protein